MMPSAIYNLMRSKGAQRRRTVLIRLLSCALLTLMLLPYPGLGANGAPEKESSGTKPQRTRNEAQNNATVLIYHRFDEDRYPTTNISAARFEEQLAYLKDNNYQVIPLKELVARLTERRPFHERTVAITIDDGYQSTYQSAWPLLQRYGYPFTVFVYVEAVDKGRHGYVTWDQMREMHAAGVDFQNHGYGHLRLASPPSGMNDKAYRAWIRADLAVSTRILAQELGQRPEFFAVPYGEYNDAVVEEARSFGYQGIFMQDPGSVSRDTSRFSVPREPILGQDWSTLDHFKDILDRVDLPLADMEPLIVNRERVPPYFAARVLYPERYVPGSLGVYVSELGWQPATVRDNMVVIANDRQLQRRVNRVAVSAKEKDSNKTAIRFWLLLADEDNTSPGEAQTQQ